MDSSERWSRPSLMYCDVSSTTIPEPLSACLMTSDWSELSSFSALACVGVRFAVVLSGASAMQIVFYG